MHQQCSECSEDAATPENRLRILVAQSQDLLGISEHEAWSMVWVNCRGSIELSHFAREEWRRTSPKELLKPVEEEEAAAG